MVLSHPQQHLMMWVNPLLLTTECCMFYHLSMNHLTGSLPLAQIKSVIRRTKETPNVHPMFRDGIIRRKMGPVIFHKSNSQDRLIEELQGKLGIARKERPKKQPDDWLTEGVIVMSNPKRLRDDHNREVDKVVVRKDKQFRVHTFSYYFEYSALTSH